MFLSTDRRDRLGVFCRRIDSLPECPVDVCEFLADLCWDETWRFDGVDFGTVAPPVDVALRSTLPPVVVDLRAGGVISSGAAITPTQETDSASSSGAKKGIFGGASKMLLNLVSMRIVCLILVGIE